MPPAAMAPCCAGSPMSRRLAPVAVAMVFGASRLPKLARTLARRGEARAPRRPRPTRATTDRPTPEPRALPGSRGLEPCPDLADESLLEARVEGPDRAEGDLHLDPALPH